MITEELIGREWTTLRIQEAHKWAEKQQLIQKLRHHEPQLYFIPRETAVALCAQVIKSVSGQWYRKQWWRCQRCTFGRHDAMPRGLAMVTNNMYPCAAMANLYNTSARKAVR